MYEWLEKNFVVTVELISSDGTQRAVQEDEFGAWLHFPMSKRRGPAIIQTQGEFVSEQGCSSGAANFYPSRIELHAKRKADGRKLRLFEVLVPPHEELTSAQRASQTLEIEASTLPGWAEEPIALCLLLHREQGWTRSTRRRPEESFSWWGVQAFINAQERWLKRYCLIGNLFVALHSDGMLNDPLLSVCDSEHTRPWWALPEESDDSEDD